MKGKLTTVCIAALLGLILEGCSAPGASAPQPSAKSTVSSYFAAVGAHQWTQANAFLSPSLEKAHLAAPDSDQKNTLALTDVHLNVSPAPFARGEYPGFSDIQQAMVTFDASYRKVYGSTNGPQTRFVYVGRQGAGGPWRILGIGTGP